MNVVSVKNSDAKKRVVALGFFDGVHIGHGALLGECCTVAERLGYIPSVLTYSRHPSEIVGTCPVKLINTTAERKELISALYGIEDIIVKDFTKEYASLSCEEFFEKILLGELKAGYAVAGYDFRFGRAGAGDAKVLVELCERFGVGCRIIDEVRVGDAAVSSSRIRACIACGDMESAAQLLGHPHCIISEILHGKNLGEKLGFPTANQRIEPNIQLPKFGVYHSRIIIGNRKYKGITNIGLRPTVENFALPCAETHILDFSGNVYGKMAKLELISFLRDEIKFDSEESLRKQIAEDVKTARLF